MIDEENIFYGIVGLYWKLRWNIFDISKDICIIADIVDF